jgi:hypothetical protein
MSSRAAIVTDRVIGHTYAVPDTPGRYVSTLKCKINGQPMTASVETNNPVVGYYRLMEWENAMVREQAGVREQSC